MAWREFEMECTDYLNATYGVPRRVEFVRTGDADSTVSDVVVMINGVLKFYIEVKMAAAQSGQFVLRPDTERREFVFSERNNSTETAATRKIIAYMNADFERYQRGGVLKMDHVVFYDWVQEHYRALGAKYVITRHEEKYLIFPVEKMSEYFAIGAVYRVKRSGSSNPSGRGLKEVVEYLRQKCGDLEAHETREGLIVKSAELKAKQRFEVGEKTYWLAEHAEGLRVRRLSKTANSNVIFTLSLMRFDQDAGDLAKFREDLR